MLNGRLRGVNPLANTGWIDDSNTIFNTKTIVFIILPVSTDTPNLLPGPPLHPADDTVLSILT